MQTIRVTYRDEAARDGLQVGVDVDVAIVLVAVVSALHAIINVLRKPVGRCRNP